ncbi:hypothetical protein FOCC_FOCC014098 [Frankliniella occidentalis]|uniref:Protein ecdysoneless isoform X1 n=1 Tax=Frankliniella occidentalis TaxID=133901 RepID=A0A6J1T8X7_FRAOC|nr:protein ecdysoneless isoform X1 [Frankliniella occidentalis]KAE8740394.1 hypothetical protein FOCC_FOCC014098 [Frankliniella occidentalis]
MASALEDVQAEDYVEYFLFPDGIPSSTSKDEVNDYLRNIFSVISCCAAEHKSEYIWHKDPFNTAPILDDESELLPPHLHGTTHFGDNIEDEWFIVYLLIQLTKDIPGLVVRVIDTDGEFLLIEAADFLPPWADPETCGQRVYLYQGEVHFIPPTNTNDSEDEPKNLIPVVDAIQLIRSCPKNTRAPQPIQNAIKERIEGYPSKIKEDLHRTTISIPAEISALLKDNPSLIASAVRAFCERDPIDKRACRNMAHFKPDNCVPTSVLFTKCLYAMLCHEKAVPEKRSGWVLPPPSSSTFKMYNLGYKVACGFEILVDRAKKCGENPDAGQSSTPVQICDLSDNRGWSMYLNSLKKKEYFKDLLEGSKEYTTLLDKAKEFYLSNCTSSSKVLPDSSAGHEILSRMSSLKLDIKALKEESKNIPPPDDDSWLEISPEEVDLMLKNRYGPVKDRMRKDQLSGQGGLATVLGGFLEYMSGMEGAEFPTQGTSKSSSKTFSGKAEGSTAPKSNGEENENVAGDSKLNFDPEGFSCAVQNILDFAIPEDSWDLNSDSDDSDIGSYEDEGEMDLNEIKPAGKKRNPDAELKQYMDQMDRELANTTLAQSFEKKASKMEKKVQSVQEDDSFDDVEDFQPVDIDMNALKNILESYQSQMGGAGPASNLLGPMGVHLENLAKKSSDKNDNQ